MSVFEWIITGLIFLILSIVLIYLLWHFRKEQQNKNSQVNSEENPDTLKTIQDTVQDLVKSLSEWKGKDGANQDQFSSSLENLKKGVQEINSGQGNNKERIEKLLTNIYGLTTQMEKSENQQVFNQQKIEVLTNVFSNNYQRGKMGEDVLYWILDNMLGADSEIVQKQYQMQNGYRPDVFLKVCNIPIDSKFPYDNFEKILSLDSQSPDYIKTLNLLKDNIKKHISDIARKYISEVDCSERAIMFLPSQSLFEFIHSSNDFKTLFKTAIENKVWITGPNTLPALLQIVISNMKEDKRRKFVMQILKSLKKLHNEFNRFHERWKTFDKRITGLTKDAKDIGITSGKIIKNFQEIDDVKLPTPNNDSTTSGTIPVIDKPKDD